MWTPFPIVASDWWCLQHWRIVTAEQDLAPSSDRAQPCPDEPSLQAAGGHARAAALTPERRTEIARTAAEASWNGPAPEDDF